MALAAGKVAKCPSAIWTGEKAVIGDFVTGKQYLFDLLEYIRPRISKNKEEFEKHFQNTVTFFNDPAVQKKYILLETQEIFEYFNAMEIMRMRTEKKITGPLDEKDIPKIESRFFKFFQLIKTTELLFSDKNKYQPDWLLSIFGVSNKLNDPDLNTFLGIDNWTKILYFSF